MKIINLKSDKRDITLVPRVFPNFGDILTVTMRNEIKDKTETVEHSWDYVDNYFTLTLNESVFYSNNTKYELTVFKEGNVIYKGKVYFTEKTDIQDFTQAEVTNKKIKF